MTHISRVLVAVHDEEWQKFRVTMKGKRTHKKLEMLRDYHNDNDPLECDGEDCDVCIRVDNYIKALCRGGQLYAGESLETALTNRWYLPIKRN